MAPTLVLLLGRSSQPRGRPASWDPWRDRPGGALVGAWRGLASFEGRSSLRNDGIVKVGVSDSLTDPDTAPWSDTTTIVGRAEAHDAVRGLKERDGGDILVFGSGILWDDLLAAGLVDELHPMTGGVVGDGVRAFHSTPRLRPLDVERREGSDNVVHRYEVVR